MMRKKQQDTGGFLHDPSGAPGLNSLFSGQQPPAANQQGDNFRYKAPRQPRSSANSPAPAAATPSSPAAAAKPAGEGTSSLMHASPVNLFKYDAGKSDYDNIGKVGSAVLGNATTNKYQLLLYHTKTNHICTTAINAKFNFVIQNDLYGNFNDDTGQNWSLMFKTASDCVRFAIHVAIAKFLAEEGKVVVRLDAKAGAGKSVQQGASVDVTYNGYLMATGGKIGTLFDTNSNKQPLKLRLGDGDVVRGWEEGMVGMRKGGKRIVVVPPHLGYGKAGSPPSVPANAVLIFEVDLQQVRTSGEGRQGSRTRERTASVKNSDGLPDTLFPNSPSPAPQQANDYSEDEEGGEEDSQRQHLLNKIKTIATPTPFAGAPTQQKVPQPSRPRVEEEEYSEPVHQLPPQQPQQSQQPQQQQQPQQHSQQPQYLPQQQTLPVQQQQSPYAQPQQAYGGMQNANPYALPVQQQSQTIPLGMHGQFPGQPGGPAFMQPQQPQQGYGAQALALPGSVTQSPYGQPLMGVDAFGNLVPLPQGFNQQPVQPAQPTPAPAPTPAPTPAPAQSITTTTSPASGSASGLSTADTIGLLVEAREFQRDVSKTLADVSGKVETMHKTLQNTFYGGADVRGMSGLVLVQTIQRILEENELFRKDVSEKTQKVDELRGQIAKMQEKSDRFYDDSLKIQEQRVDSLKEASEMARKNLMVAREQKSKLELELTELTNNLNDKTRETSTLHKIAEEAKAARDKLENEVENLKADLLLLKNKQVAVDEELREARQTLIEEQISRKKAQSSNNLLREEMVDKNEAIERLEKRVEERNRVAAKERAELTAAFDAEREELTKKNEELKKQLSDEKRKAEREIQEIRAHSESSSRDALSVRIKAREEELKEEHKDEVERLQRAQKKAVDDSYQKGIREGQSKAEAEYDDERSKARSDLAAVKRELETAKRNANTSSAAPIGEVSSVQLEEAQKKHTAELEKQKREHAQVLRKERKAARAANADTIRKVMNKTFIALRNKFDQEETYDGSDVISLLRETIRETTLALVPAPEDSDSEEEQEVKSTVSSANEKRDAGDKEKALETERKEKEAQQKQEDEEKERKKAAEAKEQEEAKEKERKAQQDKEEQERKEKEEETSRLAAQQKESEDREQREKEDREQRETEERVQREKEEREKEERDNRDKEEREQREREEREQREKEEQEKEEEKEEEIEAESQEQENETAEAETAVEPAESEGLPDLDDVLGGEDEDEFGAGASIKPPGPMADPDAEKEESDEDTGESAKPAEEAAEEEGGEEEAEGELAEGEEGEEGEEETAGAEEEGAEEEGGEEEVVEEETAAEEAGEEGAEEEGAEEEAAEEEGAEEEGGEEETAEEETAAEDEAAEEDAAEEEAAEEEAAEEEGGEEDGGEEGGEEEAEAEEEAPVVANPLSAPTPARPASGVSLFSTAADEESGPGLFGGFGTTTPVKAVSTPPPARTTTPGGSSLFGDFGAEETDTGGSGLFSGGDLRKLSTPTVPKAATPVASPAATKKSSLFGDDTEDDTGGGLFGGLSSGSSTPGSKRNTMDLSGGKSSSSNPLFG